MFTGAEIQRRGTPAVDWSSDYANGVSSAVGRTVYGGRRAVVVGADTPARTQIAALLDLLDLHLSSAATAESVADDEVSILLEGPKPEALGALTTLIRAMTQGPRVLILEPTGDGWGPVSEVGWDVSDLTAYSRWPKLMRAVSEPPPLVRKLVKRVGRPELRAYPMLTKKGFWSLRLEGLEVARVSASGGELKVGKDGRGGGQSLARKEWIATVHETKPLRVSDSDDSVEVAVRLIAAFADRWLVSATNSAAVLVQNEHALESRILRAVVPLKVGGRRLELIRPDDGIVNWGSQFPTKWGPGGSARYLDALLRDGDVPWAIEIKVQGPGGVGQYYRHAIVQAVLYREFIKGATDLHFWFERERLDARLCHAGVVIPTIGAGQQRWRDRLHGLCQLFEVALLGVDHHFARLH